MKVLTISYSRQTRMANETRAKQTLIAKPNKSRIPSKNRQYIRSDTGSDAHGIGVFLLQKEGDKGKSKTG